MTNILIITGTARKNNYSEKVSLFVKHQLKKIAEINSEIISPLSIGITIEKEGDQSAYPELQSKVALSDGIILVAPEYNHSFPGSLKMLLDAVELKHYVHKPVALVGVSAGDFAGVRMIESIVPILKNFGMIILKNDLLVGNVQDQFDGDVIKNQPDLTRRLDKIIQELQELLKILGK
jgi:NAD(P)H-dependent FMN reductase